MKDRGFTLVEVLAVIVVLSAILVIAVPTILNSQSSSLDAITKQEKKNIEDAGKMVGIDLDDYTSDIYNCKTGSWIQKKCTKKSKKWTEVKITVDDLISNNYFKDQDNHCSGNITIKKGENEYTVNVSNVKCER